MSRNYRTYTKQFKLEALELLERSGESAAQIERDLGITKGLLLKWRDRYQVKKSNGEASRRRTGGWDDSWRLPSRNGTA